MIAALALVAALQVGPGQPATPPATSPAPIPLMIAEPVAMMIAAFDQDGDGLVTRAEFDAGVKRSFDLSAKGQAALGYIAFGDWADRWLGNRNALPSPFEVDGDGDNRITLAELQARFDLFFTRFDADKDGVIRRSELLTVRTPAPAARPGEGKRRPQGR